jgi:2-polyprenyl-3-methyl-5-hydroxy-6-metoxy-1,4-benzoquinol methylase
LHNKRVRKILLRPYSRATRKAVPADLSHCSHPVDLSQLGAQLRNTFVDLPQDAEQHDFVARAHARPHSWLQTMAHRVVRSFMSDYNANGLLGMYPMHLLSSNQWQHLLQLAKPASFLDVGAGDGGLTQHLTPLSTSITATETSRAMVRRLRRRGLVCLERDVTIQGMDGNFDCVTCLNVVDRTPKPRTLVSALVRLTKPGGLLVLATPLPIRAFYYDGPRTLPAEEQLGGAGPSWERAAMQLVDTITSVAPEMVLRRWSKAAYLSWGDYHQPLYALDDFIGVWQRPVALEPNRP